jgi:hypothetical protein
MGNLSIVRRKNGGSPDQCGKQNPNYRHGGKINGKRTPEYASWSSMKTRCNNPRAFAYDRYGGRGITICARWQGRNGFTNFLTDMGRRPPGTTLDRHPNPDGNYTPTNCRWATPSTQCQNQAKRRDGKTSRYRGVCFNKQICKFVAAISVNGKRYRLGSFISEDAAAVAYNDAAIRYYGESAKLNQVRKAA